MNRKTGIICVLLAGLLAAGLSAQESEGEPAFESGLDFAQVMFVRVSETPGRVFRFDVTVRHADNGWDHYADAWQVLDADTRALLAERILAHPHTAEQPFTRSLSGVTLPEGLRRLRVRARCNVHGFGGREILVDLGHQEGEGFEVLAAGPGS